MNILMVNTCYGYNSNGGSEVVCRKLAENFVNKGHEVSVVTIDSFSHNEVINGVKVYYIKTFVGKYRYNSVGFIKIILLKFARFYSFWDYRKYKKIFKEGHYEVVNTHCIEDMSPVIWKAAYDCNVRIVHTMHERYIKCHTLLMLKKNGELCNKQTLVCKYRNRFYKRYYKMIDMFISPSKQLAQDMGVNCKVIYNGVKIPEIANFEKIYEEREREHIILYASNLNYHKGINVLLDAFFKLDSKWKLYIAGEGTLYEEVYQKTKDIENVRMLGHLDEKQMAEIYKQAYVLVIPSLCKENCPMVVLESFSYGVPAIGSNIGGTKELIDDGINGYWFETGNADELSKKIIELDNNYKKLIEKLPNYKYSLDRQVDEYLNIY